MSSGTITTEEMGLILPVPTVELGPEWAIELNDAIEQVDRHDHTPGKGAQVPAAGLDIDQDLEFHGNDATGVRSVRFNSGSAALTGALDAGAIYESGGDLFYNNAAGQAVQVTSGPAIAAAGTGSIQGLAAPASVAYSGVAKTFTFAQSANRAADLDAGTVTIHKDSADSQPGIALTSPTLTASYTLTLPASLPSATILLGLGSGGAISGTLVQTAMLADSSVTNAKLNLNLSGSMLGVGAVSGTNIGSAAVSASALGPACVTGPAIGNGAISGSKLGSAAVSQSNMGATSVGTAQLIDANVTTAKIADLNVTTGKLADLAVTTGKLADLNVTTSKIADSTVTKAKLSPAVGTFAVAGTVNGSTGAVMNAYPSSANGGPVTTGVRNSNGVFSVSVAGMTPNANIGVTCYSVVGISLTAVLYIVGAGGFSVLTFQGASLADSYFTFVVYSL